VRRHLPHLLERAAVLKAALKRRHKLCDKLFIFCRAAGVRNWHMADALRHCSETVCYLGSYRQCQWTPIPFRGARTVVRANDCWVGVPGGIMQKWRVGRNPIEIAP
jgi:hypothetical protein